MTTLDDLIEVVNIEKIKTETVTDHIDGIFYYDETNNFRKFRLKETGFNNDLKIQSCFLLGGLYVMSKQKLDHGKLKHQLNLQENQTDLKFKFFSHGKSDFYDILHSKRLNILIDWLNDQKVYVHLTTLDYLYYSITDIIDNLPDSQSETEDNRELKNELYVVVKDNIDIFLRILFRFKYPNIQKDKLEDFNKAVLDFYIANSGVDENYIDEPIKDLLIQMLNAGTSKENLNFLQDNIDHELFGEYEFIYLSTPLKILTATHIFDEELDIVKKLRLLNIDFENRLNMKFVKSESDMNVQLSDAVIGFSGKLATFLYNNDFAKITDFVDRLDTDQLDLLKSYFKIMRKSELQCRYFTNSIMPNHYIQKYAHLINKVFSR